MSKHITLTFPPTGVSPTELPPEVLCKHAAGSLGIEPERILGIDPLHFSFDARERHRVWKMKVEVWIEGEDDFAPDPPAYSPPTIAKPSDDSRHVVVIGSGPAGLFAAMDLLAAGLRVTVLERGFDVQRRRKDLARANRGFPIDSDSNYCHGEGGAGTYSDGKLYTRSGDKDAVHAILVRLVEHGAPAEVLTSWRPHIGSNRLPQVVTAMRSTIESAGGQFLFGAKAIDLETDGAADWRQVTAVRCLRRESEGDATREEVIACDAVILATGHSALDSIEMVQRAGAKLESKGFAMGVRIEHPQAWLDDRQYGGLRDNNDLPASFYQLVTERKGRGVYSFCMCPGGFMVPASTDADRVVLNGMSLSRRDSPYANSGVVVAIEPEDIVGGKGMRWGASKLLREAAESGLDFGTTVTDERREHLGKGWLPDQVDEDPLLGVHIQRALERLAAVWGGGENRAPAQRADHFAAGYGDTTTPFSSSYQAGLTSVDLAHLLPRGLSERLRGSVKEFDRKLPGYGSDIGQVAGVETRTSSPVRIVRDRETCESPTLAGLFPCGEGAGFAGGIISAALDGRRVAEALVLRTRAAT